MQTVLSPSMAGGRETICGSSAVESCLFRALCVHVRGVSGVAWPENPGPAAKIQLADAIDQLAQAGKVAAITNPSRRYDCGDKFGYLTAIVDVALGDPEYRDRFLDLLRAPDRTNGALIRRGA